MPNVQNPSAQAVLAATVSFTAAQIKALNLTPVVLVPAPGVGRIVNVIGVAFSFKFGTVAYSVSGSDSPVVKYTSFAGDEIMSGPTGAIVALNSTFFYGPSALSVPLAVSPGDDNQPVVLGTSANYAAGPIVTATLGAAGSGYAVNDTGTINDGSDDATYKILTVDGSGHVLTFQVTGAGTDYTVENGVSTATGGAQPGVGVGFTVNIAAVQTGDGTLKVTTYYSILPVS